MAVLRTGYNRPSTLQCRVLEYYARIYDDPHFAWHAQQLEPAVCQFFLRRQYKLFVAQTSEFRERSFHCAYCCLKAPAPSAFELSFLLRWPNNPVPASPEGILP